jgi:hypothetical protein
LSASASRGGIRLLAVCAAINLALAALGWLWQGGTVSASLVDKIARGGALTLGSWNWNAIHAILWALWLSGWFAFLSARVRSDKAGGPDLHKIAMTLSAAGGAASLMWLWALWDLAWRLAQLDAGRLPSKSATAGMLAWTGLPLAIGAGVAIPVAAIFLAGPSPILSRQRKKSPGERGTSVPRGRCEAVAMGRSGSRKPRLNARCMPFSSA